jgi:hypothetical protein
MTTASEKCLNCDQPVTSLYCGACGQINPAKRLNLKTLWFDFQSRVYGFDGMFPRTLKDLTVRPGAVAHSYINGNRVSYYGPVGYFFIMITVYLLLASLLGVDLSEFTMATSKLEGMQQGKGQMDMNASINHWVVDNMRLLSFIFALWLVLFTWLFFRKSGYNIIESSVLIFFISGHNMWLNIVAMILYKVSGYAIHSFLILFFTFAYTLFGLVDLYRYQSKIKILLKGILLLVVSYISLMLVVGGVAIVYFLMNPDLLEKIRPSNNRIKTEQSQ